MLTRPIAKDIFLKNIVIKSKEHSYKTSARKKRGWYTAEGMRTILKWSKIRPQLPNSKSKEMHES